MFWNTDERGLEKFDRQGEFDRFLEKYVVQCFPKTGWDELESPNHFKLVRKITEDRPMYREALRRLSIRELPETVEKLLDTELDGLFSARRKRFIVSCVRKRLNYYDEAVTI